LVPYWFLLFFIGGAKLYINCEERRYK